MSYKINSERCDERWDTFTQDPYDKNNSQSPAPFALTVIDQQLQGVEQQQLNNTSLP
jgi:hypothetical protein